jgi:hypothetical protein
MPSYEQALSNLEHLIAEKQARLQTLTGLRPQSFIDEEAFEEHRRHLQDEVRRVENEMRMVLQRLDRWPHRHLSATTTGFKTSARGASTRSRCSS